MALAKLSISKIKQAPSIGAINMTLTSSRSGNAETYAVKTILGNDPSTTDPVAFVFSNSSGGINIRYVTAALSITIPSTKHTGAANGIPFRNWLIAMDNSGTVELAIRNCSDATGIIGFNPNGIVTTSAISGANANKTTWSTTARTNLPYIILGWYEYASGLATQGTWVTAPDYTHIQKLGDPTPGHVLQTLRTDTGAVATTTTVMTLNDAAPLASGGGQFMSLVVPYLNSSTNILILNSQAFLSPSAQLWIVSGLFRDAAASAFMGALNFQTTGTAGDQTTIYASLLAGSVSSTTFYFRAGCHAAGTLTLNGTSGSRSLGGFMNSFLQMQELMG